MSTRCQLRTRIAAPLDVVWPVLVDVERMPQWTKSMRSVRLVRGNHLAVGAEVLIRQPRMPRMRWTVIELTARRSFAWTAHSAGVTTTGGHILVPRADGREVEATFTITHEGPLARLIGALTMRRTRRYVGIELAGLKSVSEAAAQASEQRS